MATGQFGDVTVDVLSPGSRARAGLDWVRADPSLPVWRARTDLGSPLRLRYEGFGGWAEFVVDEGGDTVHMSWSAGDLFAEASELLVGPVFSCLLRQRGLTCLHGAVLALDDRVIALVGPAGAGKSTTSLGLVQRGATLISDDLVVLRERDGRPVVSAGAPRLRLPDDSARALHGSADDLAPIAIHAYRESAKRYFELPSPAAHASDAPVALDAVYFLAPRGPSGQAPEVRTCRRADALVRLMANRHLAEYFGPETDRRDFEVLHRVTGRLAARELIRPEGLLAAAAIAGAIRSDVASLA